MAVMREERTTPVYSYAQRTGNYPREKRRGPNPGNDLGTRQRSRLPDSKSNNENDRPKFRQLKVLWHALKKKLSNFIYIQPWSIEITIEKTNVIRWYEILDTHMHKW